MGKPHIVEVAEDFRQQLLDNDAAAQDDLVRTWRQIEGAITAELLALLDALDIRRAAGETLTASKLYQLARYQSLLAQVTTEITRFTGVATTKIDLLQRIAAAQGIDHGEALIVAVANLDIGFFRLNTGAVESIVAASRAGKPLARLLEATAPLAAAGMMQQLATGIALGWSPRKTARAIFDDGLSVGLQHALLIARDQQIRAYREASRSTYQRSGVVQRYRRMCAKQRRTCLACLALDGTTYASDALMPTHPCCRCVMVPIVTGLPEVQIETGEAWFARQGEDVQRSMLGEARFAGYKAQQFRFRQLATVENDRTWGPTARVTPVRSFV